MFSEYTDEQTYKQIIDYSSVSQMWENCLKKYADRVAVSDNAQEYTFAQTENETAFFRTVLLNNNIGYGDRVGIFAPNSFEFVKAYLAVTTLGVVAVLLPPHLDENAVWSICVKLDLKALVFDASLSGKLPINKSKEAELPLINISDSASYKMPLVNVKGEDACTIIFTGGTTGKSKGAMLSNGAVMQGTKNGCYGYRDVFYQRYFLVLPLTHVFGLIRNLLTSLYTGSVLHICRNNKDMFKEIAVFKPTIIVLIPALAEMALNLSKQFNCNMLGDCLKYIICGAAAVPPYLISEYKAMGIQMLAGYGLTESANLVSGNPESDKKPESVGIPYEGQELKIVGGELWLKGRNMMMGYVGDDGDNERAYQNGWFKTGDLVRMDEDGYLYITGRTKEIIVLSTGENISPSEIETKFNSINSIQDCLVYDKNENGKQKLVLEVLPRQTVLSKIEENDKNQYLLNEINKINKALPSFMRISKIIIRDKDFIRNAAMKICRKENIKESTGEMGCKPQKS